MNKENVLRKIEESDFSVVDMMSAVDLTNMDGFIQEGFKHKNIKGDCVTRTSRFVVGKTYNVACGDPTVFRAKFKGTFVLTANDRERFNVKLEDPLFNSTFDKEVNVWQQKINGEKVYAVIPCQCTTKSFNFLGIRFSKKMVCEHDSSTPTGVEKIITGKGVSTMYQQQKCDMCGHIFYEEYRYLGTVDVIPNE